MKIKNKKFLKSIIIILLIQALSYFILKTIIPSYNIIKPSNLELPLIKSFVYIYNSWYPFIFITSFIIFKNDESIYEKLIFSLLIGSIISHITFIIYPSMIIRPELEIKTFTDYFLNLTYTLDTPAVNCLPSIHCLFCFISIYYISDTKLQLKYKLLIISYLLLIILSTLFTKQHLLIDLILALIYSIISFIVVRLLYPKLKRALKFIF